MNRLVAIVGLPGAGKSEVVVEFEKAGFKKIYFGGLTLDTLREENLEINESNERMMREKLRTKYGMSVYAKLNTPKINVALEEGDVVIDGLYSWEEYLELEQNFPTLELIAVYASTRLRHQRLANRPVRPLTKDEAQSRDYSQIKNLNQGGPIAMADFTFLNTGSLSELKKEIRKVINGKK